MKQLVALFLSVLSTMLYAQVAHLGPEEGLSTGEVVQVVELPNRQILVNTVGAFKLFDGTCFVPVDCDAGRCYALPAFGRYGHWWQGDSLLWLRDFYYLYLFDVRDRCFRYDVQKRLDDNAVARFMQGETGDEAFSESKWSETLRQQGIAERLNISAVCEDSQHGTWIGTKGKNLFYIPPPRPRAHTLNCPGGKAAQVVCQLPSGALLVGTDEGLWQLDTGSHAFTLIRGEKDAFYHSATTDRAGRVWICSQNGLDCYDGKALKRYDADNVKGFLHNHVVFMRQLADGRFLACNNQRELGILDAERCTFDRFNGVIPELSKYRFIVDALPLKVSSRVLVLTQNGCFLLDCTAKKLTMLEGIPPGLSTKCNCAFQDDDGRLWLGTQNGLALITYDPSSSRIVVEGCIRGMACDAEGRLWVSTAGGLMRINPEQLAERPYACRFASSDGIPTDGITERGLIVTKDNMLCMASSEGVTMLSATHYDTLRQEYATEIVRLSIGGHNLPFSASLLDLPYDVNNLELRFSALNYTSPEHTHYRYRLRGLSDTWTYAQEGHAFFTSLPHGCFVFEAQAAVLDGPWGPVMRKEIVVHPPFWLTWWACVLYAIAFAALAYLLTAWYLRRKKAALVAENDERVNRLFELREEARHRFAQSVKVDPMDFAANSREEELMGRVMASIERNMDNSGYTVDMLASDVCMSRASLYRAMQNMLGITPNDFIRNVRLKQAAQLLSDTGLSINDISARVGFGTPRYFAQHFKRVFGVLPSEYRSNAVR